MSSLSGVVAEWPLQNNDGSPAAAENSNRGEDGYDVPHDVDVNMDRLLMDDEVYEDEEFVAN